MKPINVIIAEIAKSYKGQQEIRGNQGFLNEFFEKKMKERGWIKGQAWCAFFTELVWHEAFRKYGLDTDILDKLFSSGAVQTYNNFNKSDKFKVDKKPVVGSVVIWQKYEKFYNSKNNVQFKPHWSGHAGIVISILNDNYFKTMEGNSNSKGGREGIEVAENIRKLDFKIQKGLVLKGFIYP